MKDSKEHWLSIDNKIQFPAVQIGRYATFAYLRDPSRLCFMTSRYKFCSRLLSGMNSVLEIGCGDGFGGAIVAQRVGNLICTDINEELLAANRDNNVFRENIVYEYHDFRLAPYPKKVDAIYFIDVIEHIFPDEEAMFMTNVAASLAERGVCIIGTPNQTADQYASPESREGHVNLKNHKTLTELAQLYFHNSFFFGMNDEVVHTGFPPMAHFIWVLCVGPKRTGQAG